jgi:hypothetical protein
MVDFDTRDEIAIYIEMACLDDFRATEGDCRSVAEAIQNVFGGEILAVLDENFAPRHAVVRIDGRLYDGLGSRSKGGVVKQFMVLSNRKIEDMDIDYDEHLSASKAKDIFICDRDIVEEAERRLREVTNG